jgi:hypothetical protein
VKTSAGYSSTPTTLVNFDFTNGSSPTGSLIADANGIGKITAADAEGESGGRRRYLGEQATKKALGLMKRLRALRTGTQSKPRKFKRSSASSKFWTKKPLAGLGEGAPSYRGGSLR